jgi:hypothetical protein
LSFRRIEATEQPGGDLVRPAWMTAAAVQIRPAPFAVADDGPELEGGAYPQQAPGQHAPAQQQAAAPQQAPGPQQAPAREPLSFGNEHSPPLRRSSLPPRKSVNPPQVVITRLPPPPEMADKPSPEQEAFAAAALDLASLRARILSSVESELLDLSVHIAQALLEHAVAVDPSLHRNLARTAVLALGDTQAARLRVSRSAYRAISELYGEAAIDVDGVRVEVSMDASLDALSVIAEGGPSRVDARMGERLNAVLRALQAEHRRKNALDEEEEQGL